MRVAIVVRSGPAAGRRIQLKAGQLAKFGRSNWADFAFADDAAMADVHFEIRCDAQACQIAALAKESPTLVNQQAITNARLNTGDIISAGQTSFALDIQGVGSSPVASVESTTAVAAPASDPAATARLSDYFELSAAALSLAEAHPDPESFEQLLISAERWEDAIRWRAHRLPKPKAVAWAMACANNERTHGPVKNLDEQTYQIIAAWVKDPSEQNRRQAAQQLDANGGSGVGGVLTAAVAWSGGSLAPEGVDEVPPDERLTGHCVTTALGMLSHTAGSPGPAVERLKKYLQTSY